MPKTIKQTLMGADFDLTVYGDKADRDDLLEHILQDVKDTQLFAGRHLPDKLYMTFNQFKTLEDDFTKLGETAYRIFVTPYNVMEVHVVDAPDWVDIEALTGYAPEDEITFEKVAAEEGEDASGPTS
ncbi:MAG TPA: hypothetical protein VJ836_00710 [Candidatus Saccharimonadales bacterium]|nr:hypothetical protein [Candidatus Saccharimonadales bacterium]